MKSKPKQLSPNPAAKALREAEFRQRVVKSKKHATYTRKEKHKKREDQNDDLPFFYGISLGEYMPTFHHCGVVKGQKVGEEGISFSPISPQFVHHWVPDYTDR